LCQDNHIIDTGLAEIGDRLTIARLGDIGLVVVAVLADHCDVITGIVLGDVERIVRAILANRGFLLVRALGDAPAIAHTDLFDKHIGRRRIGRANRGERLSIGRRAERHATSP